MTPFSLIFFICLVTYGAAVSVEGLKYNFVRKKDGYEFSYELEDGSFRLEVGKIVDPGTDKEELVVEGEYGRISFDSGRLQSVKYIADKNGYRPIIKESVWLSAPVVVAGVSPKLLSSLAG